MGILNKLFGEPEHKDNQRNALNWNDLSKIDQLEKIINESFAKPVFIFKHSTRCAISRMALKNFERNYKKGQSADAYMVDILEHRDISNKIAAQFSVMHQSPQLLLIEDGKCSYTASHSDIDAEDLLKRING